MDPALNKPAERSLRPRADRTGSVSGPTPILIDRMAAAAGIVGPCALRRRAMVPLRAAIPADGISSAGRARTHTGAGAHRQGAERPLDSQPGGTVGTPTVSLRGNFLTGARKPIVRHDQDRTWRLCAALRSSSPSFAGHDRAPPRSQGANARTNSQDYLARIVDPANSRTGRAHPNPGNGLRRRMNAYAAATADTTASYGWREHDAMRRPADSTKNRQDEHGTMTGDILERLAGSLIPCRRGFRARVFSPAFSAGPTRLLSTLSPIPRWPPRCFSGADA